MKLYGKVESVLGNSNVGGTLLSLVAFTLPLKHNLNSISIILLDVYALWYVFKKGQAGRPLELLLVLFYGMGILGMIYTQDLAEGWRYLRRTLPFAAIPFAFYVLPIESNTIKKAIWSFCIGLLVLSFFLFFYNMYAHFFQGGDDLFYYSRYTAAADIHPAYYSMMLVMAVFFILKQDFRLASIDKRRLVYIVMLIVFLIQLVFLQSRIAWVAFVIGTFIFYVFQFKGKVSLKLWLLFIGFIGLFLFAYSVGYTKRLLDLFKDMTERLALWNGAWRAIQEHPFFGYGTGDAQWGLDMGNALVGGDYFVFHRYNTHNQYLDATLRFGFLGLGILLFFLGKLIGNAYAKRNFLALIFGIVIVLFFMTENILFRHHGIVFIVLGYFLFQSNIKSSDAA